MVVTRLTEESNCQMVSVQIYTSICPIREERKMLHFYHHKKQQQQQQQQQQTNKQNKQTNKQ
jgi:hypothetical protein